MDGTIFCKRCEKEFGEKGALPFGLYNESRPTHDLTNLPHKLPWADLRKDSKSSNPKMKVAEIREKLEELGLETTGKKADILERLNAATSGGAEEPQEVVVKKQSKKKMMVKNSPKKMIRKIPQPEKPHPAGEAQEEAELLDAPIAKQPEQIQESLRQLVGRAQENARVKKQQDAVPAEPAPIPAEAAPVEPAPIPAEAAPVEPAPIPAEAAPVEDPELSYGTGDEDAANDDSEEEEYNNEPNLLQQAKFCPAEPKAVPKAEPELDYEELGGDIEDYTEIDYEGVDYLYDEDSGSVYNMQGVVVGEWHEEDGILWAKNQIGVKAKQEHALVAQ
jgi:hypothetical protein